MKPFLLLLACGVPALAQDADLGQLTPVHTEPSVGSHDPTPAGGPLDLSPDPIASLQTALIDARPERVLARGRTYRAAVRPSGFRFEPVFGSQAPHSFPIDFALTAASVGGSPPRTRGSHGFLR